jgi:hypothetical protein
VFGRRKLLWDQPDSRSQLLWDRAADLNFCETGRPISTFAPRLSWSWNFRITLSIYMSKGPLSFSPSQCWSQKLCLVAHSVI